MYGQTALHAEFGGVVPEIAARAHAEKIDLAVEAALQEADITLDAIDAIAVTAGPGLIGGVLAGVMCAKGLAATRSLPLIGVNHLAGHALTPRMTDGIAFPYVMLLVSGGHCQFLRVDGPDDFTRLGGTIDDAPARRLTKPRVFWVFRNLAAPRLRLRPNPVTPRALPCPGPCWTAPIATCPSRASKRLFCAPATQ